MATGAVPVRIRTAISLFVENSHLETRHQGVMFRSPRAFVGSTATLRYEPCTQFINVSQRALHIYFIDGCRVCPLDAQYKVKNKKQRLVSKLPDRCFCFDFAWLVTFNLPYFFRDQFCPRHSEAGAVRYPLGSNVGHACSIIRNRTLSQNILSQKSY